MTFEEVQQHKKLHGFDDLETTTAKKYRRLLSSDALFLWIIMIFCVAH
ncbi:hypothetical protein OIU92_16540 [Escherichia coli]|nr:hypothetical protein [Escherichia coli]